MTPVQVAVAEYLALGWKLCAINPGKKGPLYEGWNTPGNDIKEPHRFPLGWGVGLLHATSGTCAFDIDSYDIGRTFMQAREIDLDALWTDPFAIRFHRGDPNRGKLLYAMPTPRVSIAFAPYPSKDKDGTPAEKMALELRCSSSTGNSVQDVLPPSMHPSGKPYQWALGPLAHLGNLPPLPAALEALWDELKNPAMSAGQAVAAPSGKAPEAIQRWLKTQDPSMSYAEWLKVGMKLHAEFQGSAEGFGIWQMWSSGSDKWDEKAKQEMYPKWKGFKLEGSAIATLAADVRQMPAAAEEFPVVTDTGPVKITDGGAAPMAALDALTDRETVEARHNRELLCRLVYLSAGKPRYWLREDPERPGPATPEVDQHWGGLDGDAVRNIFTPHMAAMPTGRKGALEIPDPVEYFKRMKASDGKEIVRTIGFHPGEGRIYKDLDGARYLNAYMNTRPEPVPMPPDIQMRFHWLLGRIEDKAFAPWLCQFYAHAVQRPGVKIKQAPLLFGDPGTGKTTLMYTIPVLLFGQRYVKSVTHDVLMSRFAGGPLADAWWVYLDELRMAGEKKVDRSYVANKLKPWITEPNISIEQKGLAVYEIPNRVQITAASNYRDALHIEDAEAERRWGVACLDKPLTEDQKIDYIRAVYAQPLSGNWFTHYFLNYPMWNAEGQPLNGFDVNGRPPKTLSTERMAEMGRDTWQSRVEERMIERHQPFDKDIVTATDVQEVLRHCGAPNWGKVGALLHGAPFRAIEARTDTARYWAWRNKEFWATLRPPVWRDYHDYGQIPPGYPAGTTTDLLGDINAPSP